MKKITTLICSLAVLSGAAIAADSGAKDELTKAAKALGEKPNYSWKTTVEVPADSQFKPGPTEGKVEKGGFMVVSASGFQGSINQTVKKGDKIAMTNRDGGWDSIEEAEANTEGFGRFRANMARSLKAPAEEMVDIVGDVKELKKDGDVYSGELTEDGAKAMMFGGRRRGGNGQGPDISSAKGSAKFWVKDGVLSKMQIKVEGSMEFNGNERDIDRTSTTEITDVGSTKVEVPAGAKAKLQ